MYVRVYPVDDEAGRKARAAKKTACMFCGVSRRRAPALYGGVPCAVHHIIRSGRSDEACNEAFICGRCHDLVHDGNIRDKESGELLPRLTLGIVLTLKRVREPESWDPDRLQALYGSTLPDLEPIPDFLEAEYRKNKPEPYRPWEAWDRPLDGNSRCVAVNIDDLDAAGRQAVENTLIERKRKLVSTVPTGLGGKEGDNIPLVPNVEKKIEKKIKSGKMCPRCVRLGNTNPRRNCPACNRLNGVTK
jgi:hypothetical protein